MFIVISKVPRETVDEIVNHLKRVYTLCCLEKRQLLLKTLVSPLVKLKLVYLILMETNGAFGDYVHPPFDTMHDILSFFREVKPLCVGAVATPPRSPHEESVAGHNDTEELAVLLYTAVTSYIAVVKGNLRRPAHIRFLEAHKEHPLTSDDMLELGSIDLRVEELRSCLQSMVGPGMALSSRTTMYLEKMCCLRDLSQNVEYREEEVIVL